jgi:soluble lytic murein transglycosylase
VRPARRGPRFRRRRPPLLRRRRVAIAAGVAAVAAAVVLAFGPLEEAVRELTLPLRHDDVIRQQAREKDLDPALIAAVIYQETKFRDRTSPAGAKGLMQILPDTARFIARKSGGTAFELRDLANPQINIA